MRSIPLVLASLALPLAAGCGADCGKPTQINGTYAVFANVIQRSGSNMDHFPSYMTPANGWTEWTLTWNRNKPAKVSVVIDGQPYTATGSWDEVECGNFTLDFAGTYLSINDSTHEFAVTGDFVAFGPQIEGRWDWEETWTSAQGETGTFSTIGQVSGTLVDSQ